MAEIVKFFIKSGIKVRLEMDGTDLVVRLWMEDSNESMDIRLHVSSINFITKTIWAFKKNVKEWEREERFENAVKKCSK